MNFLQGAVAPRGNPGGRKDVNALLDELRKIVEAVPDSSNTVVGTFIYAEAAR